MVTDVLLPAISCWVDQQNLSFQETEQFLLPFPQKYNRHPWTMKIEWFSGENERTWVLTIDMVKLEILVRKSINVHVIPFGMACSETL